MAGSGSGERIGAGDLARLIANDDVAGRQIVEHGVDDGVRQAGGLGDLGAVRHASERDMETKKAAPDHVGRRGEAGEARRFFRGDEIVRQGRARRRGGHDAPIGQPYAPPQDDFRLLAGRQADVPWPQQLPAVPPARSAWIGGQGTEP